MFPSADVIATAICAAARELVPVDRVAQHAIDAASGKKDAGPKTTFAGGYPLSRIRLMAAVALWEVFPDARRIGIAECVGQGSPDAWASAVGKNLKAGVITWLDDDAHERVRGAIVMALEMSAWPVDLPGFLPSREPLGATPV